MISSPRTSSRRTSTASRRWRLRLRPRSLDEVCRAAALSSARQLSSAECSRSTACTSVHFLRPAGTGKTTLKQISRGTPRVHFEGSGTRRGGGEVSPCDSYAAKDRLGPTAGEPFLFLDESPLQPRAGGHLLPDVGRRGTFCWLSRTTENLLRVNSPSSAAAVFPFSPIAKRTSSADPPGGRRPRS